MFKLHFLDSPDGFEVHYLPREHRESFERLAEPDRMISEDGRV